MADIPDAEVADPEVGNGPTTGNRGCIRAVHGIVVIYQVEGGEGGWKESRRRAALTSRVLILGQRGSATWYQMAFNLFSSITSAPQILFPLKGLELTNRENASFSKAIPNVMTLVVPTRNSVDAS